MVGTNRNSTVPLLGSVGSGTGWSFSQLLKTKIVNATMSKNKLLNLNFMFVLFPVNILARFACKQNAIAKLAQLEGIEYPL
jgi:hypothetical protein